MNTCLNCKNAIYDERFCEKRCSVYNHDICDVDKYLDCKAHQVKEDENER